jgi:hypothetical protein
MPPGTTLCFRPSALYFTRRGVAPALFQERIPAGGKSDDSRMLEGKMDRSRRAGIFPEFNRKTFIIQGFV